MSARPWNVDSWKGGEQYGEYHSSYQNYGNDSSDQIFKVGDNEFIDGIEASDIAQGEAGLFNYWIYSRLPKKRRLKKCLVRSFLFMKSVSR